MIHITYKLLSPLLQLISPLVLVFFIYGIGTGQDIYKCFIHYKCESRTAVLYQDLFTNIINANYKLLFLYYEHTSIQSSSVSDCNLFLHYPTSDDLGRLLDLSSSFYFIADNTKLTKRYCFGKPKLFSLSVFCMKYKYR